MRISTTDCMLSEAAIEDALIKLCVSTNEPIQLTLTTHPANIYEAGRCTAYIGHFDNLKITIRAALSFGSDEWMLQYKDDYIRSGIA